MLRLNLLTALLLMNLIASSQVSTLKPVKIQKGDSTYRCFDELQSKAIAKYIVGKEYGDSIQDVSSQVIHAQDSIIKNYSQRVVILRTMVDNSQSQINNLNILNATLRQDLGIAQKQVARMKRNRWFFFGAGVLSAATITWLVK